MIPIRTVRLLVFGLCLGGMTVGNAERFYTSQTMRTETRLVLNHLERQHFQGRPVELLDMRALIEDFLFDLDNQKLFLYQSEVDEFKAQYAEQLPDLLRKGRLDPAFEMFDVFSERFERRLEWVFDRLDQPFDFSLDETFNTERDEASWPENRLAADDLWERRMKYQLLNEILANYGEPESTPDEAEPTEGFDELTEPADPKEALEIPDDLQDPLEQMVDELENPAFPDVVVGPGAEADADASEAAFDFDAALADAREVLRQRYEFLRDSILEMDGVDVQEVFLTALANRYDPHSTFMSANTVEEFEIAMRNSLVGIGAVLTIEDSYCTIRELIPGGPAEKSDGIHPGDRIVGVAQGKDGEMVDVIGMPLDKVVRRIRGEEGTVVRLLLQPAGSDPSSREELSLVRDQIQLTSTLASAKVFTVPSGERTVPVGVIELPAFYGADEASGTQNTTEDVAELIEQLKNLGVEGLVLDLRSNGGGLLSEAVRLTGLFIDKGPVVQVRNSRGKIEQYEDEEAGLAWEGPLAVLVSRYSASASEITAGALKIHARALIIGDRETHGKGTVQAVYRLNQSPFLSSMVARRGAAKVTVQKFYLPDGSSTQIRGVASDIALPSLNGLLPIGENDLPNALAWDTIPASEDEALLGKSVTISPELVGLLRTASENRRRTLEEFDYLRDSIERFQERYERDEISLNLSAREIQRMSDRAMDKRLDEKLTELDDLRFDGDEVLTALARERQRDQPEDEKTADEPAADRDPEPLDIHLRETLRIMADWVAHLAGDEIATSSEIVAERDPKEPRG